MRQGLDSPAVNGPHSERMLTDRAGFGRTDGRLVDFGIRLWRRDGVAVVPCRRGCRRKKRRRLRSSGGLYG